MSSGLLTSSTRRTVPNQRTLHYRSKVFALGRLTEIATGALRRARVEGAFPILSPISTSDESSPCSNGEARVNGLADTFVFVDVEVDDGPASVSCPRTCVFSRLEFWLGRAYTILKIQFCIVFETFANPK